MRNALVFTVTLLLLMCGCNNSPTTGDKNIRITVSKSSFSLSENIHLEIAITGKGIFFIGPCDSWFERKTDLGWEAVGECPNTNFTQLPFSQDPGDHISFSLPMKSIGNTYDYNYVLSAGVYRYAIMYESDSGSSTCYSPEFTLVDR
jgi:hypothetical protein